MRIIVLVIFTYMSTYFCHAETKISCINDPAKFDIFKEAYPEDGVAKGDIKLAYSKFVKSEIITYDAPRPYLYSTDLSFTNFFKRICHDQICDGGDFLGTLHKCVRETTNSCVIIAATKGKNLYCLLKPVGWDTSKPYDPFEETR